MKEKMSLEEATMKALLGQLDTPEEQKDDVEGIIDGVLVVTDPEITPDEYTEVIDNAQEILEDTPEGEVPFNDQYVGEYLLTCPICGSSFINKDVLNVGDSCPICTEVPEQGFILNGQVATQEDVELQNDIKSEEEREENDDVNIGLSDEESIDEEPVSEEDVEEVQDELLASEVTRESDKKLEEASEYKSKFDEVDELLNLHANFAGDKMGLYNYFNSDNQMNREFDEERYYNWLEDMKENHFNELYEYLLDLDRDLDVEMDMLEETKENYIKRPEQLNENKETKVEFDNTIKEIKDKLDWLSTHNKNYTKAQYYTILDLQDLVDKLDDNSTDRKLTEINECTDLSIKTESNKHISAEEKLEAIYDDYDRQGMRKMYWTDLLNLIDDFDALDRWFDASYPEDDWENGELD